MVITRDKWYVKDLRNLSFVKVLSKGSTQIYRRVDDKRWVETGTFKVSSENYAHKFLKGTENAMRIKPSLYGGDYITNKQLVDKLNLYQLFIEVDRDSGNKMSYKIEVGKIKRK